MRPRHRIVLMASLALSLWTVVDGMRCLYTGHYAARLMSEAEAMQASGVVVPLEDGVWAEYGLWAWPFTMVNIHPNSLAPFFVAYGLVGFFALALYMKRRPTGWTGMLAFAVVGLGYLLPGTLLAALILVVLLLPSTRREFFGVTSDEASHLHLEVAAPADKAEEPES
jgi:hypothetical protein